MRSCQRCGAPLHAAGDADALCPACLLQLALDAAPADSADLADDAFGGSEAEGTPRCRVIGMLGGGAHGRTYLAETEDGAKLPRFVALKRPDAEVAAPDAHARLLEEQRRVARVNHPAFAKMLEAGVASGRPYFLFEYIRGLPIRMYCDRRRLGVDARLALVEAVAAAMADAHRAGLAHGALSASNIVITGASGPLASRILDLGERQALAAAGASGIARPTAEDDLRDLAELRQVLTAGV